MDVTTLIAKYRQAGSSLHELPDRPALLGRCGRCRLCRLARRPARHGAGLALSACAVLRAALSVLRVPHHRGAPAGAAARLCGDAAGGDRPGREDDRAATDGASTSTGAAARRTACPALRWSPSRRGCASASPLPPDAEVAVEVDPRTLDDEALDALAAMGVNRASLGVQDFDPKVQDAVGRLQSFEATSDCAEQAARHRCPLDQSRSGLRPAAPDRAGVRHTVAQALEIGPDRAAVFGYAHVPWMKKQQTLMPEDALPGPAERFAQRQAVEDVLVGHGYAPHRAGPLRPAGRHPGEGRRRRAAEAQLPGLYHRRRAGTDRPGRVVDRLAAAGLCAEPVGCAGVARRGPAQATCRSRAASRCRPKTGCAAT